MSNTSILDFSDFVLCFAGMSQELNLEDAFDEEPSKFDSFDDVRIKWCSIDYIYKQHCHGSEGFYFVHDHYLICVQSHSYQAT